MAVAVEEEAEEEEEGEDTGERTPDTGAEAPEREMLSDPDAAAAAAALGSEERRVVSRARSGLGVSVMLPGLVLVSAGSLR
jgi:hypothetical protein